MNTMYKRFIFAIVVILSVFATSAIADVQSDSIALEQVLTGLGLNPGLAQTAEIVDLDTTGTNARSTSCNQGVRVTQVNTNGTKNEWIILGVNDDGSYIKPTRSGGGAARTGDRVTFENVSWPSSVTIAAGVVYDQVSWGGYEAYRPLSTCVAWRTSGSGTIDAIGLKYKTDGIAITAESPLVVSTHVYMEEVLHPNEGETVYIDSGNLDIAFIPSLDVSSDVQVAFNYGGSSHYAHAYVMPDSNVWEDRQ